MGNCANRFLFGEAISVSVVLLANFTASRGVFAAFPALLLASLTLIRENPGTVPSVGNVQRASWAPSH